MGIDILVGAVGERHDLAHGLRVVETLVELGDARRRRRECGVEVRVRQFAGELAAALGDETCAAARDVDELADEIGVHAGGEITERKVDVVDAGAELGGEVVAQRLGRQAFEVTARRDESPPRLRHLLAVDGQEAVHMHRRRLAVA